MKNVTIHSDGAARGNPGPAGAGAVISDSKGKMLAEVCEYLGDDLTNNQAEYHALILALGTAKDSGAKALAIYADSELMVKQIRGEYKVKNSGIRPLFDEARRLLRNFDNHTIDYIPREKNKAADKLANMAIDRHTPSPFDGRGKGRG